MKVSLTILILLILSTSLHAQAPPSQYEHLRPLEDHIGTWVGEMELPDGEGTMQMKITYSWIINKSYIHGLMEMGPGEELFPSGGFMYGWDGKDSQLRCWTFWSESQMTGSVTKTGNTTHFAFTGTYADGAAAVGDVDHTIIDDTMTIEVTNRTRDGEALPDIKAVLRRSDA